MDPGQHFHDGRFPGAVLTDDRMDLASRNPQRDVIDSRDATKAFDNVIEPNHLGSGGGNLNHAWNLCCGWRSRGQLRPLDRTQPYGVGVPAPSLPGIGPRITALMSRFG